MPGNRKFHAVRSKREVEPARLVRHLGAQSRSRSRSPVRGGADQTLATISRVDSPTPQQPVLKRDALRSLLASIHLASEHRDHLETPTGDLSIASLPSEDTPDEDGGNFSLDRTVDEELLRSFLYVGPNYRAQLQRSEAVLLFAAFRLHRALSDAASLDLLLIGDALAPAAGLGVRGPEVDELLHAELLPYGLDLELYCVTCSTAIVSEVASCPNKKCERYRAPIRTDGSGRYRAVATCKIEPQLRRVLTTHLSVIRASITRANAGPHDVKHDLCDWPAFLTNAPRDDPTHIWLTGHLSADGFPIKENYKGECWPLLLQVCELPLRLRESYDNTVVAGCFVCTSKPTQYDWRRCIVRLAGELEILEAGVPVNIDGEALVLHFRVVNTVMDLAAVASAYNLKTWAGPFACAICEISGASLSVLLQRNDVSSVQVFPPQVDVHLRTSDRVEAQMDLAEQTGKPMFGFKGRGAMQRVCCCSKRLPESLHTLGEGIFADIVGRLTNRTDSVSIVDDLPDIDRALEKSLFPTHFPRDINNLSRFRKASYHEKELIGIFILPLIFAMCLVDDSLIASTYLMLAYAARLLAQPFLSQASTDKVVAICTAIRTCFPFVVGARFCTLKLHYFMEHVPFLCITSCTPFDSNSNAFEAFNKQVRYPLNPMRTRGVVSAMLESCLLRKTIFPRFAAVAAKSRCTQLVELAERWTAKPSHLPRQVEWRCEGGVFIPTQSSAKGLPDRVATLLDSLSMSDWPRYGRLVCNGRTFTAAGHWHRATKTCQYDVVVREANGTITFARALLFVVRPDKDRAYVVLRPYLCADPFSKLREKVRATESMPHRFRPIYERFFDLMQEDPFWMRCDGNAPLRVVRATRLCGYCAHIQFSSSNSFIVNLEMKAWHE